MSALGHAWELARLDVRRTVRKYVRRLPQLVLLVLMAGALSVFGGYLARQLTPVVVANDGAIGPLLAIEAARGLGAILWLFVVAMVVLRTVGQRGTLSHPEGVLTVVPTGEAVVSIMVAEVVYFLVYLLPAGLGLGAGFALATGDLAPLLTAPLGMVVAGVSAVSVGFPVGLLLRHVLTRFPFVVKHKTGLVVLVFLLYMALVVSGGLNEAVFALFEPMQASPSGWLADLTLLGVAAFGATPVLASGALVATDILAPVAVAGATLVADRHWFADPVLAGEADAEEPGTPRETPTIAESGGRVEQWVESAVGRPVGGLVVLAWRRAVRAPMKLLYAAYPLLVFAGFAAEIVQTGRVPSYLAFGVVLFVAWAAGVIFTLNPLGDQGAALPATLLSAVRGRGFVRAHVLAGLVVALPAGTLLTAVAVLVSPLDAATQAALVLSAPLLMAVSAALSVGIGTAFPRFEAITVTRSMEAVVPSLLAFALFTAHLLLTAGAAVVVYEVGLRRLAAAVLTWVLPFGLSVTPETLYLVAAGALVPLLLAPVASYRYAVRRFDRYVLG